MKSRLIVIIFIVLSCSSEKVDYEKSVEAAVPDFMTKDLQGNIVILSYFKEQPVILRFLETDGRFVLSIAPGRKISAIVPGGVGEAELDELVEPYLVEYKGYDSMYMAKCPLNQLFMGMSYYLEKNGKNTLWKLQFP